MSHLTVKYTFLHFIDTVFNFEGKFWKSLWGVIARPGFLTNEYISGRIQPYIMPFKLFVFVLFVILLVDPADEMLPEKLDADEDPITYNLVSNITEVKAMSFNDFRDGFNSKYSTYFSFLLFGMMFVFAVPLKLFFVASGRYLSEHLIFSAHFFTFIAITLTINTLIDNWTGYDLIGFVLLLQFAYLLIAFKRVYNQNWIITIGETSLLFVIYIMVIVVGLYFYMAVIGYTL